MRKKPMHTLHSRAWLRNDCLGICLAVFASIFCLPLVAADEKSQVVLKFVDAETKAPLAHAKIVVDAMADGGKIGPLFHLAPDPLDDSGLFAPAAGEPPLPVRFHSAFTDVSGVANLPILDPKADMLVIHEKGLASMHGEVRQKAAGVPIEVKLLPWATLEGRVIMDGKPCAGAVIALRRGGIIYSVSGSAVFSARPIGHGVSVVADADGKFRFERLVPAQFEGENLLPYAYREFAAKWQWRENVSYTINQIVTVLDIPLRPGLQRSGYIAYDGLPDELTGPEVGTVAVKLQEIAPSVGEHITIDLQAQPRFVRQVRGRLVWEDGTPVKPSRDPPKKPYEQRLSFSLAECNGLCWAVVAQMMEEDGRFSVKLPVSGRWIVNQTFQEIDVRDKYPSFMVPAVEGNPEKLVPLDLGDIVLKRR